MPTLIEKATTALIRGGVPKDKLPSIKEVSVLDSLEKWNGFQNGQNIAATQAAARIGDLSKEVVSFCAAAKQAKTCLKIRSTRNVDLQVNRELRAFFAQVTIGDDKFGWEKLFPVEQARAIAQGVYKALEDCDLEENKKGEVTYYFKPSTLDLPAIKTVLGIQAILQPVRDAIKFAKAVADRAPRQPEESLDAFVDRLRVPDVIQEESPELQTAQAAP